MKIVGIDPSLTGTGVAALTIPSTAKPRWQSTTVGSKPVGPTLHARYARLRRIIQGINRGGLTGADEITLVVIEAPSFGQQRQGGQHDRMGLWWEIVRRVDESGIPIAEVPPACRAKYGAGKGNAPKDAVLLATAGRYPTAGITNNNEADAVLLAAMGARHLGAAVELALPAPNLAAMGKVLWPATPKGTPQ